MADVLLTAIGIYFKRLEPSIVADKLQRGRMCAVFYPVEEICKRIFKDNFKRCREKLSEMEKSSDPDHIWLHDHLSSKLDTFHRVNRATHQYTTNMAEVFQKLLYFNRDFRRRVLDDVRNIKSINFGGDLVHTATEGGIVVEYYSVWCIARVVETFSLIMGAMNPRKYEGTS